MEELRQEITKLQEEITTLHHCQRDLRKNMQEMQIDISKIDKKCSEIIYQVQQGTKATSDSGGIPPFDRRVSWRTYIVKFEAVAALQGWDETRKARELLLKIPNGLIECLLDNPRECLLDYQFVLKALDEILL